ncbi:hypothetical protein JCM10207_003755 [Rhodosporidiobolus poonsookiae]
MGNLSSHEIAKLTSDAVAQECRHFDQHHQVTCDRLGRAGHCSGFADWFDPRRDALVELWNSLSEASKAGVLEDYRWLVKRSQEASDAMHNMTFHPAELKHIDALYFDNEATAEYLLEYPGHDTEMQMSLARPVVLKSQQRASYGGW